MKDHLDRQLNCQITLSSSVPPFVFISCPYNFSPWRNSRQIHLYRQHMQLMLVFDCFTFRQLASHAKTFSLISYCYSQPANAIVLSHNQLGQRKYSPFHNKKRVFHRHCAVHTKNRLCVKRHALKFNCYSRVSYQDNEQEGGCVCCLHEKQKPTLVQRHYSHTHSTSGSEFRKYSFLLSVVSKIENGKFKKRFVDVLWSKQETNVLKKKN